MDKPISNEDLRYEKHTPLFFRFMAKATVLQLSTPVKVPYIQVDFYQTDQFVPSPFHRPISKIIRLDGMVNTLKAE